MATQEVYGLETADKALRANTPPRARTLDLFEREVNGTRFDDRPPWTSDLPIYEKRPCIIYRAVDSSIQSKIDLLLGEGRFPTITSHPEEDEDEDEDGLSEDDSQAVDKLVVSITKEARLRPLFRELYENGQGCGTAIALLGQRNGRLFGETLPAKWAIPKRDSKGELVSIVIQYPFIKTQQMPDGKWEAKCFLYRREINAQDDITFAIAEARVDGIAPKWQPETVIPHGLGFVPVIWYKHRAPKQNIASEDGNPVHQFILNELEELDLALSQKHHGALGALPQIVETGVDPGYNPTSSGDTGVSAPVTMLGGPPIPGANPVRGSYKSEPHSRHRGSRKKGPNFVWQYESPDTKVAAINTPGDALKALADDCADLRNKICETLAWVPLDPDSIKFAATVSGKALEILRERELNRVCHDREIFGEDVIIGVVSMLLRIALKAGAGLRTPRLKKCLPILQKMTSGPSGEWQDPRLSLVWPSFFVPTPEDDKSIVDMTKEAHESGFITKRTAVQAVSRIFGISNIDAYLETLEEEAEEKRQQEQEDNAAALAKFHGAAMSEDDDDAAAGPGKGPSGKPKANSPVRTGGAGPSTGNPAKEKTTQSS